MSEHVYPWETDIPYRLRQAKITEPPSEGYPTILGKTAAEIIEKQRDSIEELKRENADLLRVLRECYPGRPEATTPEGER